MLCPTWPTQGNWNQSTHINYQRFLDAANGGPIPWETKHDRSSVSHEEHAEEDAEATGGFDRTNVTICFFQQVKWFQKWWARSEDASHVGLCSRFLFGFGMSSPPGHPKYHGLVDQVAFRNIRNLFKATLKLVGPRTAMTAENNLHHWSASSDMHQFVFQIRNTCHDMTKHPRIGGIARDGSHTAVYWLG